MPPNSQGLAASNIAPSESDQLISSSGNGSTKSTPTKSDSIGNGANILTPSSQHDFSGRQIPTNTSTFLSDNSKSASSILFPGDNTKKPSPFIPINAYAQNQDLDIIGALGNLDLDFELPKAGKLVSSTSSHSHLNTPLQQANGNNFASFQGELYDYPHGNNGSLTPNPVSMGFQFPNTPSNSTNNANQWGSSLANIPASAPPFNSAHSLPVLPPLPSIRPFHLPEDQLLMEEQNIGGSFVNNTHATDGNNGSPLGGPFNGPYGNISNGDYNNYGLRAAPLLRERRTNYNPNINMNNEDMQYNQANAIWNQNNMRNHPIESNDRRWFNNNRNEMNVHRKMNFRRKGEDASKFVNARLEDFTGEIYVLCKDQHGCRFLQRQLDLGNEISSTLIFNEIYLHMVELMTDPFGNYLIQKLLENVSTDQRIILVKNASPEFIRIALDPHGTRALQKLVECIDTDEEAKIITESLSPHIVSLSRDLNGNHVVQKCLQKLKPEDNQFIFDTASVHCMEIATHRHGCCVLQRCLDHGNANQCKQLSEKVAVHCLELSLDPFGNYVVQYVLARGDQDSINVIMNEIKKDIISLSTHKFGSNVIEKSLRIESLSDILIKEMLVNKEQLNKLLHDAFGNYVLQTSLDVASQDNLNKLAAALKPLLPTVRNTPHGRRILSKIQSCLN